MAATCMSIQSPLRAVLTRRAASARVMGYRMLPSSSLFTSEPIPGGASWTLTTYFGKMLSEAEELYGRRDMDWTPIGVEFFAGDVPRICVFPGGRKHVLIRLTLAALNDWNVALWQL